MSTAGGLPSLPKFLPPDGTSSPASSNPELKESLLSVIEKMSEILTDVAKSVHLGTEGMEFVNFMCYSIEMILASWRACCQRFLRNGFCLAVNIDWKCDSIKFQRI